MPKNAKFIRNSVIFFVTAFYLCWAAALIYKSSATLSGGERVFCLFEDAMISMRYAENLVHGNGPVWNPGERVEGYTNPLSVVVMALFLAVCEKSTAVLLVQILGALLVVATMFLALRIYRRTLAPDMRLPDGLMLLFLFSVYTLSYWAIMGMETGFVAFFLMLGMVAVTAPVEEKRNICPVLLLALSGAGLYLSRPDAILFALVILVFYAFTRRGGKAPAIAAGALMACVVATHLVFRWAYYGSLLPNTAVLKLRYFPLLHRITGGAEYLLPFIENVFPLLALSVLAATVRKNPVSRLILVLFAVATGYQLCIGGDFIFYWRLMSPALPLLVILAADGAQWIADRLTGRDAPRAASLAVAVCIMIWALHQYNGPYLREMLLLEKPHSALTNERNVQKAYALRDLTKDTASVGVLLAGCIPFYSERYAIDFLGKANAYIANLPPDLSGGVSWGGMHSVPGHNKYDLTVSIIRNRPTYIQGTRWGADDVTRWAEQNYVQVSHMGVKLLLLKDSPDVFWDKIENDNRQNTDFDQ